MEVEGDMFPAVQSRRPQLYAGRSFRLIPAFQIRTTFISVKKKTVFKNGHIQKETHYSTAMWAAQMR